MVKNVAKEFKQQIADLYTQGNKLISILDSEYSISRSSIDRLIKKYCKI